MNTEIARIKPTHVATNNTTGEVVEVSYNKDTKQYEENIMVALIESEWSIELLSPPEGDSADD